jgi:polar amino acid transport system ATP-binding protein
VTNVRAVPVRIRGVTKPSGTNQVLKGVDLDVRRGEVVAVIGSSGSGKTTLPRCVNFLEEYDGGSVRVDGEEVGFRDGAGGRNAGRSGSCRACAPTPPWCSRCSTCSPTSRPPRT